MARGSLQFQVVRTPPNAAHCDSVSRKSRSENLTPPPPAKPNGSPAEIHTLPLTGRALLTAGVSVQKAWLATLRIRVEIPDVVRSENNASPGIFLLWHNCIFAAPRMIRHFPARPGCVLTSASRDGAWIAAAIARFGLHSVRGSSSRRGSRALRELLECLREGWNVAITPDGPRGPRYVLGPGALALAQLSSCPIHPVHFAYTRSWRLRSWDRFHIPHPFSRVSIAFGGPISIPQTPRPEAFELERLRVENALRSRLPAGELPV